MGQEASTEALLALQAATNRVPVEILDVLTGANEVMVTVKERWSGEDAAGRERTLEHARALEYTVADGQLRTCRVYETAQHEIDDWLAG